ncbi:MAG: hypothetical protein A2622_13475 [Bdellovibrionales bacterium RIFCSPHIGHO2_01_FULL_40_29]|nr:MAG: hypothetical protein A2622_13475 [Bdellovibrionales bacterium RIFCSPHIGHO2_01_FULL_40_29]OFZ34293.1 MAG: hypothetical protein A3D17_04475 [Bdellovibrionales bacterium RIFCSPHIGHO2_02_FULL_40_15]
MRTLITKFQQNLKFRSYEMHKFMPKVSFEIEVGSYILKTATHRDELKSAFLLRNEVFFGVDHSRGRLYDIDQFDSVCDHLIILHKETKAVVGTYRMNHSSEETDFYSSMEFKLQTIISSKKSCVELGRACIAENHRNGIVISLLWRGIYAYMKSCQADILFGCSSIKNMNSRQAALVMRYFESVDLIDQDYATEPQFVYHVPLLDEYLSEYSLPLSTDQLMEVKEIIPSLLKSYIKFGAKVTGPPAWDTVMNCMDFLTVMRVENLSNQVERKFRNN